jgi:hypothetical protein
MLCKTIALAGSLYLCVPAVAQKCPVWKKEDCNPVEERAMAAHVNLGGPTGIASLELSGYVTKAIKVYGGLGYLGVYAGATYDAPIRNKHMTVYAGADISLVESGNYILFIPVGVRYIFCSRLSLGGEVLPGWSHEDGKVITGALKIGYCFSRKA